MRPAESKVVFSANEAADITGHSTDSQRNNRRYGYLPKIEGHARYDLFDLFRLAFIADAAKFKIGPQQSHEAAEWVAHHALFFALHVRDAIDADWQFLKEASYWPGYREAFPDFDAEKELPGYAARQVFTGLFKRPMIQGTRYGVFWPGGSEYFCDSLDQAFDSLDVEDPRFGSPALIIDHRLLAARILAKIGGAVIKIS
jgi:hypothetical protein